MFVNTVVLHEGSQEKLNSRTSKESSELHRVETFLYIKKTQQTCMLDYTIRDISPLSYHLSFIIGLINEGFLVWYQS
jgi:hypothetical protein